MNSSSPTAYFRLALQHFGTTTARREAIMAGTGIDESQLTDLALTLPSLAHVRYFQNLIDLCGESWILETPAFWREAAQGEYGLARLTAPTFNRALDVTVENFGARWPGFRVISFTDAKARHLIYAPAAAFPPTMAAVWRVGAMMVALNHSTIVHGYFGADHETIAYEFEGPEPGYASRLAALLGGDISWQNRATRISVPRSLLSRSSAHSDAVGFEIALQILRHKLSRGERATAFAARTEMVLRNAQGIVPELAEAAQTLGLSIRSLSRGLKAESTSFRIVRDTVLKARIAEMATGSSMKQEAIAGELGYSDAASLQRAARRLFGKSLSQIRRLE